MVTFVADQSILTNLGCGIKADCLSSQKSKNNNSTQTTQTHTNDKLHNTTLQKKQKTINMMTKINKITKNILLTLLLVGMLSESNAQTDRDGNLRSCNNIGFNTCTRWEHCEWTGRNRNSGRCQNNNNNSGGGTTFSNGLRAGQNAAERIWRNDMRENCANVLGNQFRDNIRQVQRSRGWNANGNNFRATSFNKGARAGMQKVIDKYEKKCLSDSADECIALGNEAAAIIANRFCETPPTRNRLRKFQEKCRQVGINKCRGNVSRATSNIRQCNAPNTRDLRDLQRQCTSTVNTLLR